METRSYRVEGMSCEHCVRAVRHEVAKIERVVAVEVDLGAGVVVVTAETPDDQAVRAAVSEAGYEVVG